MTGSAPPTLHGAAPRHGVGRRVWWPRLKRVATWSFFGLVAWLLVTQARTIDWPGVLRAVADIPLPALLSALLLAACSFALYSTYDLLGRHMTRHGLGTGTVMGITFISYAFNLNLGSLIGGVAFRYRLYSRHGLSNLTITRVLGFSMLTNWLGYLLVAGLAFYFWPFALPSEWKIGQEGVRTLGGALLVLALAYLVLCAVAREHTWDIRGHELQTPALGMALLQLAMSCTNWALIGGVIWFLLQQQLPYPQVLAVLLVAAVAGVITHVPAGLGVLEAVFVALLSSRMPADRLLGALLAYRAIYYLLPLCIASAAYFLTEVRTRHRRRRVRAPRP